MIRVLDLFSGVGGFSLGLERTQHFKTVAFCEINPFCRRVLAKHWPEVPIYEDVRQLTAARLVRDGIVVDAIAGGFPCQDISIANTTETAGLDGARSGLWREYARLIGELRPRYAIVENVANLLSGPLGRPGGWFGRILGDLAALGYDAEWHSIPASAVGAPHPRDRVWIVAYPRGSRPQGSQPIQRVLERSITALALARNPFADAWDALDGSLGNMRADDGISPRMVKDQLGALGNALVPQIPEIIGRAIMEDEAIRGD